MDGGPFTAAVLLALTEAGFRTGLRLHAASDNARKQIGTIQGAVLGMLSLMLGFTFAIAVDRYNWRRGLVIQEANAVGTTYLRASLLPDAHQAPVKNLLRRYVDLRLQFQPLVDDSARLSEGLRLTAEVQAELWKHATESAKEATNDITARFIESLNETIDTHAERVTAMRSRIPGGVWLMLLSVAAFGCFTTGYGAGAEGARTLLGNVLLPLLISVVIVLIFDLTNPRQGLIGISQQPLLDLQQSCNPKSTLASVLLRLVRVVDFLASLLTPCHPSDLLVSERARHRRWLRNPVRARHPIHASPPSRSPANRTSIPRGFPHGRPRLVSQF